MNERTERIAAARAAAFEALTTVAGGASLCTVSRESLPAAKYHEGAVAALGDALRAARTDAALPRSAEWGAQWARLADTDRSWKAYVVGGREALAHLEAEAATSGSPATGRVFWP